MTDAAGQNRTVDSEVMLKLSIAKQHEHNASFAGSARHAVAEGFSAIDSVFAALLLHQGMEPPRNHQHKLEHTRATLPAIFGPVARKTAHGASYSPGVSWDDLQAFYRDWLQARYDTFQATAGEAGKRIKEARTALRCACRWVAEQHGLDEYAFLVTVDELAFGNGSSAVSQAIGDAHDRHFEAAASYGEEHGSRLGSKLAATTNYSELSVISDDALTQSLIERDEEIADTCVSLYDQFIRLVDTIQCKRLERIAGASDIDKAKFEDANQVPNFLLAMKMRYHGATISENGERWGKAFAQGLSSLASELHAVVRPE